MYANTHTQNPIEDFASCVWCIYRQWELMLWLINLFIFKEPQNSLFLTGWWCGVSCRATGDEIPVASHCLIYQSFVKPLQVGLCLQSHTRMAAASTEDLSVLSKNSYRLHASNTMFSNGRSSPMQVMSPMPTNMPCRINTWGHGMRWPPLVLLPTIILELTLWTEPRCIQAAGM